MCAIEMHDLFGIQGLSIEALLLVILFVLLPTTCCPQTCSRKDLDHTV